MGDGEYQIRVVASDEAANPLGTVKRGSRVSDPIFVDNNGKRIPYASNLKFPGVAGYTFEFRLRTRAPNWQDYAVR